MFIVLGQDGANEAHGANEAQVDGAARAGGSDAAGLGGNGLVEDLSISILYYLILGTKVQPCCA